MVHNPVGSLVTYIMLVTGLITVSSSWLSDQPELLQDIHITLISMTRLSDYAGSKRNQRQFFTS